MIGLGAGQLQAGLELELVTVDRLWYAGYGRGPLHHTQELLWVWCSLCFQLEVLQGLWIQPSGTLCYANICKSLTLILSKTSFPKKKHFKMVNMDTVQTLCHHICYSSWPEMAEYGFSKAPFVSYLARYVGEVGAHQAAVLE